MIRNPEDRTETSLAYYNYEHLNDKHLALVKAKRVIQQDQWKEEGSMVLSECTPGDVVVCSLFTNKKPFFTLVQLENVSPISYASTTRHRTTGMLMTPTSGCRASWCRRQIQSALATSNEPSNESWCQCGHCVSVYLMILCTSEILLPLQTPLTMTPWTAHPSLTTPCGYPRLGGRPLRPQTIFPTLLHPPRALRVGRSHESKLGCLRHVLCCGTWP